MLGPRLRGAPVALSHAVGGGGGGGGAWQCRRQAAVALMGVSSGTAAAASLGRGGGGGGAMTMQQHVRASGSSSRWKMRQGADVFAREAKVRGLKSRAAFKLLELDQKHKLFKKGQLVVDLGYAPGSWSQVAMERTKPTGRVLGIDVIPAQPPKGVATIQGNFLSPAVQALVKDFVVDVHLRQARDAAARRERSAANQPSPADEDGDEALAAKEEDEEDGDNASVISDTPSYIDRERAEAHELETAPEELKRKKLVDIVLSDMSEPWPQTTGFSKNSLSVPYRMMNTSGMSNRDHLGSMDLCSAALQFASDTLRPGGHFVCKFYQGHEDKAFEERLKHLFKRVFREKPDSSRSESKESFFVALSRKKDVDVPSGR